VRTVLGIEQEAARECGDQQCHKAR